MKNSLFRIFLASATLATSQALAGQGAQRILYTVPNSTFIEDPSGDNVVTINDTSGSIATLQTAMNNARNNNQNAVIAIHLLNGATYSVSSASLVLASQECLIGTGALIQAANASVTVPLVQISAGSTNVSVAGGTFDGNGANIYGIFAPSTAARVNIDKVTVRNCGQDCLQLNGNGNSAFDDEMTVTRCDVSGSLGHSGISIWNATQTTCVDNNCHNNSVGIWMGNCGYCNIANNTCESNSVGIDFNSGSDDYIVNNSCIKNATGILANGSSTMIVSDLLASNTVAGINSGGGGNIYSDNLFGSGNATNFIDDGSGDDIVAYKGALNGSDQSYFYPPLINDQHNTNIVNGMGRYDLTDNSTTTIDAVQNEYNAAASANPGDVIVLHLKGNYTIGANPLTLGSDTCVLLSGTIQINSSTTASCAITASSGASYISVSGGVIDGGTSSPPSNGRNGIYFSGISMFQIDSVTLQNFGNNTTRVGGSDVIRIDHGNTPRIVTRCTVNGGSARGIWVATSGIRDIISDNAVTDVQMDGVDCDESTTASVVKFNHLYNNTRYGVFLEQSASYNLVLGNLCNYDASFDIACYNNSTTPRGATAFNSIICNSLLGDNGLRNGSTGDGNSVTSSDNFFFDNTVMNANIQSQLYGSQNYFSQNYMGNSSLSTSGTEVFFNSPDVSGNLQIQDSNSGLDALVQNAAVTNGAPVITGTATGLGNDEWQLIPTDSGYYRLMNEDSGLALVVLGASTNDGANIIQWTYNASGNDEWMPQSAGNGLYSFVNRLSGLYLDVAHASTVPGTQLDQQPPTGTANQKFALIDTPAPPPATTTLSSVTWTSGGAPDGSWTNPANWSGTSLQTGDSVSYGSGSQLLTTNNFLPGLVLGNIAFNSSAASFTLYGNGVVLAGASQDTNGNIGGGTITDASVNSQTANLPVTLAAGGHVIATQGGAGSLILTNTLTCDGGATVQFNVSGGAVESGLVTTNGIVGGWAVYSPSSLLINNNGGTGAVDWATTNSSGAVMAYSGYAILSGSGQTIPNSAKSNVKVTGNGSSDDSVASGTTTINSLIWSSTTQNGYIDIPASSTLRLGAQGGILHNDNKYLRIGNGQSSSVVTAGGADNTAGELCVYNLSYYAADAVEFWCTLGNNGSGAVTVTAFGSVKIDNPNNFSGGTYVDVGDFYCNGGGNTPFGSGPVYVCSGGRADLGGDNGATVTNSFYIAGLGFLKGGDAGAMKGTYNGSLTGIITLLSDAQIDPNAGTWPNTCTFSGGFSGSGSLTLGGPSNVVAGVATIAGNCIHTGDTIIDATANANGGSGIFVSSGKNNILNNGGNLVLIGGGSTGKALVDLDGTTQNINGLIATNGNPANAIVQSTNGSGTLAVGGNSASSAFEGILQNGGGTLALTKDGSGTLTLANTNTYTGPTIVSNGVLALSGEGSVSDTTTITISDGATLDASGRADQTLTLNSGQTLNGNGTINASLTVGAGATIAPGYSNEVGTVIVANSAQLHGTTLMKLNASEGIGDQINAGSFIYGGTLTVTNTSGTFTAGQSFQLFSGNAYSGFFGVLNLPALGAGLVWNTNVLSTSGALQVVSTATPQPVIAGFFLSGTNLIFIGSNGLANQNFYLLASTNLAQPASQWPAIATNSFDSSGGFILTNTVNPGAPQQFYLLKLQ